MDFKKITAPSLKELFVKEMEGMILSGRLAIGERLPSERDLADQMSISRTIVHAGLAELEAKGFINIRPRVGIFVSDYRQNGSLSTLVSIMSYNGGMLKRDEVRSIIEVRIVLERLILMNAVPRMSEAEMDQLETLLHTLEESSTAHEAAENCFAFQHQLAVFSGNTLVPLFYGSFKDPISSLWIRYCDLYGIKTFVEHERHLFALIKSRNLEEALSFSHDSLMESISGEREIYY